MSSKVRIAVIGVGIMGSSHVQELSGLPEAELTAVCDIDHERADRFATQFGVPAYYNHLELLEQARPQAVVVATPHYFHTPISIDALQRGVHVLTEKPLAVHVKDGRKMVAAFEESHLRYPGLVFAIMFQQRTHSFWRKIKSMIDEGQLGRLARATWIITDWFRSQRYYDNGGWRATWQGEGGGVLLNQCPHNLDLYQWYVGLPRRVTGFASLGKYHNIEVEDEVTGFFEYENGMVGHFVTTTAESPGTNRLEIAGEYGQLVFEDGRLTFFRNRASTLEFIRTSTSLWDKVEGQAEEIVCEPNPEPGHRLVLQNFLQSILNGSGQAELVAPAPEGLRSLTLGNAMLFSSLLGRSLDLPFDEDAYEARLHKLIRTSRFHKIVQEGTSEDITKSFGRY